MRTFLRPTLRAGVLLAVLILESAFGATLVIKDTYNGAQDNSQSGFALNTGVNKGIDPPTTRLTGSAKAGLRYIQTVTTKPSTAYQIRKRTGWSSARLVVLNEDGSGRFALAPDETTPLDFASVLGTAAATPANPVVYDLAITMANFASGIARFSFGVGTVDANADQWDFGVQLWHTPSSSTAYTIQKRIDVASFGGAGDINASITTMANGTVGTEVSFLIRVTDAGAETTTFSSRIQVSLDGGNSWIYDTSTDAEISHRWRFDGPQRFLIWDQASLTGDGEFTYDDFSVTVYQSVWNGGGASDDNWSTSENWGGWAPNASGDGIIFAGSTRLTPLMQDDYSVRKVQFDSDAGSFVIGAAEGKTLTLTGDILQNGANAQTLNLPISIAATRTVNTASGDLTIGGSVSGAGGLTKSGDHMLTLGAANTYAGDTTVSAGTLVVNGSIASGAATVEDTATLGGAGTIGGNVTVEDGGSLSAGVGGIGTLTVSGDLTLESGSTVAVEVERSGPSSDLVTGIGTLTMGGTLGVANTGAALVAGDVFTLFSATSKSGEFAAISPSKPDSNDDLAWDTPHLKANGILRVHRSPDASDKTVTRPRDLSVKIPWSELFDSTDADGDPVVLESFTASVKGATITSNATYLFYDLPGSNDDDEFYYTATDNRGGKRTKKITVQVSTDPVTGQAQQITVVGGEATVCFAGVPGARYDVQRATDANFTENLTTVLSTNAPANGLFLLVEEPGLPQAYYRLKYPGTPAL